MASAFISYTHDSAAHKSAALRLSDTLRANGVETVIDQYLNGSPPEGWPAWMERQVAAADHVLIIWTETYRRRYDGLELPGTGRGAVWESALTRQALYESQGTNTKFVPVVFDSDNLQHIPQILRQFDHYCLPSALERLLRFLTRQPAVIPQPLGAVPHLPAAAPRPFGVAVLPPSAGSTSPAAATGPTRRVEARVTAVRPTPSGARVDFDEWTGTRWWTDAGSYSVLDARLTAELEDLLLDNDGQGLLLVKNGCVVKVRPADDLR